ncbi:hypothetical protein AEGHOMDF_1431 [Methylobacterium soli]|nr:hypothetical protein AEGHOMDF_1431 [Methylobacterium soli]
MPDKPGNNDRGWQGPHRPMLKAAIRLGLGRQLQKLYAPVLEEPQSTRIAQLLQQLDAGKPPQV